jgi:predicted Zn-dependent protease
MTASATTRRARLALVLTLFTAAGCATLGGQNYYSVEQEWQLGQQIEAQLATQLPLTNDATLNRYVNDLGQRLVRGTNASRLPWRFHVVRDGSINAFNVPGGLVYVHTGLIAQANSASELAGAMAHEVAHGTLRHGTQQLSRANELNAVAGAVLGQSPNVAAAIAAQIAAQGTVATFSRAAEREADDLGVGYMAAAGYDPEGLARLLEQLAAQGERGGVALFRTHPLSSERVQNVRAAARRVDRAGLRTDDSGFAAARRRAQSLS